MPTPSSHSSRERETREAPDTALLSKPETYGSFAASLPGATSRDASSILPGSPTYGSAEVSPFLNTPERAAYARGRSMAAAVAAEAEDAHPDPRARVEAFAADLARVVRQPSDAMYAATGREDPTAAMLREFKRALEAGDEDEDETVEPDSFSDQTHTQVEELEALTRPILAGSRVRRAGYGSTARERKRSDDDASERGIEEELLDLASPLALDTTFDDGKIRYLRRSAADMLGDTKAENASVAASPGRASARMRRRARARTDPESTDAASPTTSSDPGQTQDEPEQLFKIQCGRCSCMLKIPESVKVFRCPRCASKLKAPTLVHQATNDEEDFEKPEPKRLESNNSYVNAEEKQKRSAFDEELASLRKTREALERHVAFSKSLEGVVGELAKRVPRVAA